VLKKIPVTELRIGMHLQSLEGPWMDHPFWRTRFVIDSTADLKSVQGSAIKECWIDTRLGLDVRVVQAEAAHSAAPGSGPAAQPAAPPAVARTTEPSRSFDDELKAANAICQRGRAAVASMFNEARMGRAIDAEGCLPLVEEITQSVQRNPGAMVSLARLKTQDDYSYMHSVAVCALMVTLARQLGQSDDDSRAAGLAGLTHDIGKALMPHDVLNKPGKLTADEWVVVRGHPQQGHSLLVEGQNASAQMLDVALHHHEKLDGSGYPFGLAGEQVSLLARMGAVCDVYDAITSNRPYKTGWDPAESIAQMASWKGHFDEAVFSAFVRSLGIYPTGSLVRMHSGRLAVVVEQNPGNMVSPVVKVFFSTKSDMPITPQRLDLSRPGCSDRILGREPVVEGQFVHIDELWADPEVLRRKR
jgi:HD-GYP domain-containing protein (c-di-GMP phosphodiesterase class II)